MKLTTIIVALASFSIAPIVSAHCQVPCGIFDDKSTYATMLKDQETIEKAMKQIAELSKDSSANANQIARWVSNKEQHAQSIQDTVAKYYLAQRVKLGAEDQDAYVKKLIMLHEITVYAMKCKQTTDTDMATKLKKSLEAFQAAYTAK